MEPLIVNKWELGIGESPYKGFDQMFNVDIFSKPGSLKMSNSIVVDSNSLSVVTELIVWASQDPRTGDLYGVDRVGKVYKRDAGTDIWSVISGNGTSGALGNGLAIWKNYLFVARTTKLDVYGPLSGSPAWTNDWQTLESADLHPMLSSYQRFVLYIGNDHFIDTLEQNAGQTFDPSNAATYTYNSQDLELASEYSVTCLEEQGSNLSIGTDVDGTNIADVFFWDGVSDFILGGSTVRLVEDGVKQIKNANNTLFSIAGTGVPRVFEFVTSQSREAKRFNNINVPYLSATFLTGGGIDYKEGEVLFGVGGIGSNPLGVYSLRNGAYVLRYPIATGHDGNQSNTDTINIGIVKVINRNQLLVSWRDQDVANQYGVGILTQYFHSNQKAAQWQSYVDTAIYQVGTDDDPKTFEKCQITLGKALKAGDAIRVEARYDLDGLFTQIALFSTQAVPALIGKIVLDTQLKNLGYFKNIQLRISLDVDDTATESVELISVKLE